jgi:hypothetical protein
MEPYSLTFKRRTSDNVGHEYLYVYDQTGGNSRPGIKTLFAHDVESLEVTDIDFTPRFEIQLAKAGDSSQSGYFSGTSPRRTAGLHRAGRSRRSTTTRTGRSGPKYVVRCVYCGKEFKRSKNSARLNTHKDRFGNACPGRFGQFVRMAY